MKKAFLLPLVILILASCGVKHNVSQKYISEISSIYLGDLPEYSNDNSVFWNYILDRNVSFKDYMANDSKLRNKTSAMFWGEVNSALLPFTPDDESLKSGEEFADFIAGSKYADYLKMITYYPENSINASAYPNGVIYIYSGMLEMIDGDFNKYLGVVAHEAAHVLLRHAERHTYTIKKKERKDNIMKGIAAGLVVAAGTVAIAASAEGGTYSEELQNSITESSVNMYYGIEYGIDKYAMVKKYEYSREQEVEADIVALMFLKWMGKDPVSYIELMSKMPKAGNENQEYRSHPTMEFRIKCMKDFIGMPDRLFEVGGLKYTIEGWKADEFLEKYPHAIELSKTKSKASKKSQPEIDSIYN